MFHSDEFRRKEVINIRTAEKLGFVRDVNICIDTGKIESVIIPGGGFFTKIFTGRRDYVIPWECITRVGKDIVLVDYSDIKEAVISKKIFQTDSGNTVHTKSQIV